VLAKQFKWAALWWFVGGLFSALLNYVLVPEHGGAGAAITQSASFAFIALGILGTSQAKCRMQLTWVRLITVMAIIIGASFSLVPSWHPSAPFSLLLKLPLGVVTTIVVCWIAAPDWSIRAIEYLRHRKLNSGSVS
jgi:O-antigen/teichoic acid export membrane protein